MSLHNKRLDNIEDFSGQCVVVSTKDWVYRGKLEVITSGELVLKVGDMLFTVAREAVETVLLK